MYELFKQWKARNLAAHNDSNRGARAIHFHGKRKLTTDALGETHFPLQSFNKSEHKRVPFNQNAYLLVGVFGSLIMLYSGNLKYIESSPELYIQEPRDMQLNTKHCACQHLLANPRSLQPQTKIVCWLIQQKQQPTKVVTSSYVSVNASSIWGMYFISLFHCTSMKPMWCHCFEPIVQISSTSSTQNQEFTWSMGREIPGQRPN